MLYAPAKFSLLGGPPFPSSAEAAAFLARTSGLSYADKIKYDNYISGLAIEDVIWSKFDALWTFAAPNSTTSPLNLISVSFTCTPTGSPSFTAYQGYTGVDASSTVYLDTGFNPATASSPKFTQNSAHFSLWSNTSAGFNGEAIQAMQTASASRSIEMVPRYGSGDPDHYWIRINDTSPAHNPVTNTDGQGHFLANRNSSSTTQGYRNATDMGFTSVGSAAVSNQVCHILGAANNGTFGEGWAGQVCAASIGSSLTSAEVTKFYNRLRTYMTAVGVP